MSIPESKDRNLKPEDTDIVPATARQQQSDVVYHRSPTLLAGASGGSPKGVQVWAPNTLTLLSEAGIIGILVLLSPFTISLNILSLFILMSYPSVLILLCAVVFTAINIQIIRMVCSMPSLRNKVYITTDASGIAIRTHKGETRAVYWKEIQSLTRGEMKLTLYHPDPTEIRLRGFSPKTNKKLLSLVTERTQLVPSAKDTAMLVKPTSQEAAKPKSSKLWNCFSEKAKQSVINAQNEAASYGNPTVEPEHFLLALLSEDNIAARGLVSLGITPEHVSQEVRAGIKPMSQSCSVNEIQLGKHAKKVLDYAYAEATEQQKDSVTTGSLLLGILRHREGPACDILNRLGVTIEAARQAIQAIEITVPTEPKL